MGAGYEIITRLVAELGAFEQLQGAVPVTYEDFVGHLAQRMYHGEVPRRALAGNVANDVQQMSNNKETDIAILVTCIYRYAKLYGRKALQGSPLQSLDDFSYLVILLTHTSLTKTELIHKNVHEKTTGMEIIKRLIKHGLMHQFSDEADKRTQRIAITEAGKELLHGLFGSLGHVSLIMTGNLTEGEKQDLRSILNKLDHYHFDIFMNRRNSTLEELAMQAQ